LILKIKTESDVHVEFRSNYLPNLKDTNVFVIAGDLGQFKNEKKWLIELTSKYPNVEIVVVAGNHSYYTSNIQSVDKKLKELSKQYKKIHYLQNESVVINDIRFIGSVLWTDFNNSNPLDMHDAQSGMNDYKYIRYNNGESRFTPYHAVRLHREAKEYIFKTLEESEEPCIVVTHHKPFVTNNNYLSSAFEAELRGDLIESRKPPIMWFSGHDHTSHNYTFDCNGKDIRFISNPLGYPGEITGFNENLIIEIEQ
jgi:predicted phosphohydrolase